MNRVANGAASAAPFFIWSILAAFDKRQLSPYGSFDFGGAIFSCLKNFTYVPG
jgi:hypothetical protein